MPELEGAAGLETRRALPLTSTTPRGELTKLTKETKVNQGRAYVTNYSFDKNGCLGGYTSILAVAGGQRAVSITARRRRGIAGEGKCRRKG